MHRTTLQRQPLGGAKWTRTYRRGAARTLLIALTAILAAAALSPAAFGDVVVLEDGGRVDGKVVFEERLGPIKVLEPSGRVRTIARSRITAIVRDEPATRYVRLARYRDGWSRLEVAVVTLVHRPSGRRVTLAGAVHIGDRNYYHELQRLLDAHDIVLFEGVGADSSEDLTRLRLPDAEQRAAELRRRPAGFPPPPGSMDAAPDPLTMLQTAMGRVLDLEFQKDCLTYERSWWKPADVSVEELQALLRERGFGALDLLKQRVEFEAQTEVERILAQTLRDALAGVFVGKPLKITIKEAFGALLAAQMGGESAPSDREPSGRAPKSSKKPSTFESVLILARNDVALRKVAEALTLEDAKRIAVFYGAGHMPDLERRLRAKGFERETVRWLPAWEMRWDPRPLWERVGEGK